MTYVPLSAGRQTPRAAEYPAAMSKERRKAPGQRPGSPAAWGIVVRRADGRRAFYFEDPERRAAGGQPLELWGRESQAARFSSQEEAQARADAMELNSAAKEYQVVPLPR